MVRLVAGVRIRAPARIPAMPRRTIWRPSLEGVLGTGRLMDDPVAFLPDQPERADEAIEAVLAAHRPYWTVLA